MAVVTHAQADEIARRREGDSDIEILLRDRNRLIAALEFVCDAAFDLKSEFHHHFTRMDNGTQILKEVYGDEK
jgi:hypothetical protein